MASLQTPLPVPNLAQLRVPQVVALQNAVGSLQAQVTSVVDGLGLLMRLAAFTPPANVVGQPYDNPYADDTHLVFVHSVCAPFNGQVPWSTVGTVDGYRQTIKELKACGVDGMYLNLFGLTQPFIDTVTNILAAAGLENDAVKQADGSYASNGQGVTKFRIVAAPDMTTSGAESDASLTLLSNLFAQWSKDPSYFTFQGQPVLSCYVGDGAVPGETGAQSVAQVYPKLLAQIRAKGINPLFLPGWAGTNGSTSADEALAAGADGISDTFAATNVLGVDSQLAAIETMALSVQSAKTLAGKPLLYSHPISPYGYTKDNQGALLFYNEFGGGRAKTAQFNSLVTVTKAPLVLLFTLDDADEGTAFASGAANAHLAGHAALNVYGANIADYYQTNAGLREELAYDIQRYKMGASPVITQFKAVIYNRTQLAAAAASFSVSASQIVGIAGDPQGLLDTVNVTVFAPKSCTGRLSGVGPSQFAPIQPGFNQVCFYNAQAGTPLFEILVQKQVVCQVYGHTITATAPQLNLKPASFSSSPGVTFTVSAALPPAFVLDHAGMMCRSTNVKHKAMGVCNVSLQETSHLPVTFAQNTLNSPASIGKAIDQVTGMDTLSQYDLGYGTGQIVLLADPLDAAAPPLAFPNTANTNCMYDFSAKPLTSNQARIQCRVVSTNPDPYADGQGGCGFVVRAGVNTYFGVGCFAYIEKYAGNYVLYIKAETNIASDITTTGPAVLASLSINALAPGEWYDISLTLNGSLLTASATPSNMQVL